MNDENTEAWMVKHGLIKLECAIIQPSYEFLQGIEVEISELILDSNRKHNCIMAKNTFMMRMGF